MCNCRLLHQGKAERDAAYEPLLRALEENLPLAEFKQRHQRVPRVLCPGSGLGRLPFEVIRKGYAAQGNEVSYFMLLGKNDDSLLYGVLFLIRRTPVVDYANPSVSHRLCRDSLVAIVAYLLPLDVPFTPAFISIHKHCCHPPTAFLNSLISQFPHQAPT